MSQSNGPNAQQIAYWNEVSGPKWVALANRIDAQIAPIGLEAIERAAPALGERVIDVGCGCGQTTLELAGRVGPSGQLLGIDISRPMLAEAERRAAEADGSAIRFLAADAQTHAFAPDTFDLVFSRFGIMFFEDPIAAFSNLCGALRPGGRLVFACWQAIERNPWMWVPAGAAAKHVTLVPPSDPHAPGPFAFADMDRVGELVTGGGFTQFKSESVERKLVVGGGLGMEEIVDFLLQMGPAGAALRDATPDVVDAVRASMHEVLKPYHDGNGLSMDSAVWLVEARRPE